jgi:hypothetical protein
MHELCGVTMVSMRSFMEYGALDSKHTWYGSNWFRSRLEARWAVFFDKLGVSWVYEPETFEFDGGTKYTPDFRIKDWNCYIEIKPSTNVVSESSVTKLRRLCRLKNTHAALLVVGQPSLGEYGVTYFKRNDVSDATRGWVFGEGRRRQPVNYLAHERRRPIRLSIRSEPGDGLSTARPLFRRSEIKRLRNAYDNAMAGPPLLRNGHWITADHDCPFCKDMAASGKHG